MTTFIASQTYFDPISRVEDILPLNLANGRLAVAKDYRRIDLKELDEVDFDDICSVKKNEDLINLFRADVFAVFENEFKTELSGEEFKGGLRNQTFTDLTYGYGNHRWSCVKASPIIIAIKLGIVRIGYRCEGNEIIVRFNNTVPAEYVKRLGGETAWNWIQKEMILEMKIKDERPRFPRDTSNWKQAFTIDYFSDTGNFIIILWYNDRRGSTRAVKKEIVNPKQYKETPSDEK